MEVMYECLLVELQYDVWQGSNVVRSLNPQAFAIFTARLLVERQN